jgi:DNA primase
MDVIALDRAGIGEAVAPNGTALTEGQLERLWRLDPSPILCFDGDSAGQKAAIRAALRALPHLGPERTLRFVELPAGQDPDDVVKSGGKAAMEALLERAEPLDARLWRHELAAQPLTTPEARAGLRQRLIDHSKAIADQSLARLYRDEWLSRFDQEVGRPAPSSRKFTPQRRGSFVKGRFVPPEPPASATARAIATGGIDKSTARALVAGFVHFPEALARHCEQLAELAITDRHAAAVRDRLVDAAHSCQELDRDRLLTILQSAGASADLDAVLGSGGIAFSFTRSDTDPALAARDLGVAVEALAASGEVELALLGATRRFEADMSETAYAEQQRLVEAKQRLNQRLASLVASDYAAPVRIKVLWQKPTPPTPRLRTAAMRR